MIDVISTLRKGIIVSCQAEGDDPFNRPEYLAAFASAAEMGGAVGIRAQGVENIKAIRSVTHLPIIGITKGVYDDGWVLITPDFVDVGEIVDAGADIVALDVTYRMRPNGMDGYAFFERVREKFSIPLMADVSTFDEGVEASELGADLVATTLSGYTSVTEETAGDGPDFALVERLTMTVKTPVIAEGRIWDPRDAITAIKRGAHAVVVGSAITRPRVITKRFVEALKITL